MEVFRVVEAKKGAVLDQVSFWDKKERITALSLDEVEARNEARERSMNNGFSRRKSLDSKNLRKCG